MALAVPLSPDNAILNSNMCAERCEARIASYCPEAPPWCAPLAAALWPASAWGFPPLVPSLLPSLPPSSLIPLPKSSRFTAHGPGPCSFGSPPAARPAVRPPKGGRADIGVVPSPLGFPRSALWAWLFGSELSRAGKAPAWLVSGCGCILRAGMKRAHGWPGRHTPC